MRHSSRIIAALAIALPAFAFAEKPAEVPKAKTPLPDQDYVETVSGPGGKVTFDMVRIPAGKFMFSPDGKQPPKETEVKALWIGRTELTWDQWFYFQLQFDLPKAERRDLGKGADAITRPSNPYSPPEHNWGTTGRPALHTSYTAATR